MSILKALLSREILPSTGGLGSHSLRWLCEEFKCVTEDEIQLQDRHDDFLAPPFVCKFSRDGLHGHLLALAGEDGCVRLCDTRKPLTEASVKEFDCFDNSIYDIAWVTGGNQLLMGSANRTMDVWDVVSGCQVRSFKYHKNTVKAVDTMRDEPSMFLSACRDGQICVWDTRYSSSEKPVYVISPAHPPPSPSPSNSPSCKRKRNHKVAPSTVMNTVTAALFHADNKVVSVGAGDGVVKIWDLRRHYHSSSCSKNRLPVPWLKLEPVRDESGSNGHHGFSSLVADSHQSFIYATCRDGVTYKYSSAGGITKPVGAFSGSTNSYSVKSCLSPDDKFLLTGSGCGNAFIWEVDNPKAPPLVLPSEAEEVMAVAWCPSLGKVVISTDTAQVMLWRMKRDDTWAPATHPGRCRIILRNWISCAEHEGTGHLKAREVLKRYSNIPYRTPLRDIKTSPHQIPSPDNREGSPPKKMALQRRQSSLKRYFKSPQSCS